MVRLTCNYNFLTKNYGNIYLLQILAVISYSKTSNSGIETAQVLDNTISGEMIFIHSEAKHYKQNNFINVLLMVKKKP